jgi:Bacterial transferase hexapeptide (six repeats)
LVTKTNNKLYFKVEQLKMDSEWADHSQFTFAEKISVWKRHIKHNGLKRIIQMLVFQKIFRINCDIPWPVHWTSIVSGPQKIKYKDWHSYRPNLGSNIGCYISAANGIEVGINLRVGPGVKIISADHDVNNYNKHTPAPPIKIGDNVWLGSNSVILPGVEIGNHTVVAAGAVVTKSFKEGNCILGGVPAKIVKELPDYESSSL